MEYTTLPTWLFWIILAFSIIGVLFILASSVVIYLDKKLDEDETPHEKYERQISGN